MKDRQDLFPPAAFPSAISTNSTTTTPLCDSSSFAAAAVTVSSGRIKADHAERKTIIVGEPLFMMSVFLFLRFSIQRS
jgi:hypothetical protein